MQIERVRKMAGVTVRCMPGAGATPSCRIAASAPPRSSLPPPALTRTNSGPNPVPDLYRACTAFGPKSVLTQTERSTELRPRSYRNET